MKRLVDVVNFNADASCLPSAKWLEALSGGTESVFSRWLRLYVDHGKKIVLGLTGASVADIATWNPEAIDLINRNPGIFEIILRPFAHDIALLRTGDGFSINFEYGTRSIRKEFRNVADYYLPPEFMLTNEQITRLSTQCVSGVFINPARFPAEICERIPTIPYMVQGLLGKLLACIPVDGKLTEDYLHAIHHFECVRWNERIQRSSEESVFSWRDGESPFLFPGGLRREELWLGSETTAIRRDHLLSLSLDYVPNESLGDSQYRSYPVHSFSAWMKEFRMIGFLNRVQRAEMELGRMTREQVHQWLQAINSDILSAVEKKSPVIRLRIEPEDQSNTQFTVKRTERGFEGEEYLAILDALLAAAPLPEYVWASNQAHMVKMRGRISYLRKLDGENESGT